MSVPARRGPWWYYTRTEEGKSYAIHCRRPARGRDELPPAGEPGEEEQILLDENVEAAGSEYFAVGSAAVSHDHRWLAYSTDRAGDEKYELRFRPLDADIVPGTAPEMVPETSYGLAWSAGTDVIFYVRMDEAQRPHQLWRHRLGTDPAGDELVYEETDRRFSLGTGSTRDTAFVLLGLHSTNTSEWRAIPSAEPLAAPTVVMPRREGVEYAVDHLTPSTTPDGGWFVALTNDGARDFRVLAAPDAELGSDEPGVWREVVPPSPGRAHRGRGRVRRRARLERAGRGRDPGAGPAAAHRGRVDLGGPLRRRSARCRLDRPLTRQPVGHLAERQPRARLAGAADRAHDNGHPLERPSGRPRRPRRDAPQTRACPGRLRRGPLRDLPRVGRRGGRDARPDLRRAPQRPGAAGTVRPLRLRRVRDVDRPVLLAPPPLAPRPRRRVRHRARAGRRRDGPGLVRGRPHGAQGQHLLGLHRLRAARHRARHRARRRARRPRRLGRRPADRRRCEPSTRALPRARRPGAVRRLRHHHARRRAPADRGRMGGVGQSSCRRGRVLPHAHVLPLRQRQRHQP